ncbi:MULTISPECIES: hypothetical protein [Geobacillus thermoleovorans group]|uniref:magnesium chelatase subunit ChlI family protein n=1 Tax=Geobacillus thermoleovorans group TaxID=1505648 RepID=UPI0009F2E84B|nr:MULTISPECIES: hypothetical protein [Geobacillus thermoleovorans group]MED4973288.1 hypothetical protein [Geobacillus thermoleovorans]QCK81207.1 hypothetical protein E5Z46_01785 [Geobacillus kaustophilus NBRC 102445]
MEKSPLANRQQLLLQQWASQHQWSNRVQTKIIRLARTISDLKGTEKIADESLWEAMTLRWMKTLRSNRQQRGKKNGTAKADLGAPSVLSYRLPRQSA